jgi:hypothetical protein
MRPWGRITTGGSDMHRIDEPVKAIWCPLRSGCSDAS